MTYKLDFLHYYFKSNSYSWKNHISEGGGVVNYYLNHIIFILLNLCGNFFIKEIKCTLDAKKNLQKLNIIFFNNKINIIFKINLKNKK